MNLLLPSSKQLLDAAYSYDMVTEHTASQSENLSLSWTSVRTHSLKQEKKDCLVDDELMLKWVGGYINGTMNERMNGQKDGCWVVGWTTEF
jgi:hypothetical protein